MIDVEEIIKNQHALFYENSVKEYIKMSDGAELLVIRNVYSKDVKNVLFLSGYLAIREAWSDFLDAIYEDFNLYVLETREKPSSKLKFRHKGDIFRYARDIFDTLKHFNLELNKTVIIASSNSGMYIARAIAEKLLNPVGIVLLGPIRKPNTSQKLIFVTYLLPSFILQPFLKAVTKKWFKTIVPEGIQYDTYKRYIETGTSWREKKNRQISRWDSSEDFKAIKCPTWIFGTKDDIYHPEAECFEIQKLITNSKLFQMPYFGYMHFNPDAKEFAKFVKKNIDSL